MTFVPATHPDDPGSWEPKPSDIGYTCWRGESGEGLSWTDLWTLGGSRARDGKSKARVLALRMRLWRGSYCRGRQLTERQVRILWMLQGRECAQTCDNAWLGRCAPAVFDVAEHAQSLSKCQWREVCVLRWTWDQCLRPLDGPRWIRELRSRHGRASIQQDVGSDGPGRQLRTCKLSLGDKT